MSKASTVRDTLEVARQLAEVRSRIEKQQAQMKLLETQVELSTISVNLESSASIGVLHWRPFQTIKVSASEMAQGLADFADWLLAVVFKLPVIALWTVTIVAGIVFIWRIALVLWRRFLKGWIVMKASTEETKELR